MILLAGVLTAATATVPDLYGLGARSAGAGGGGVALVDDGTAAHVNPAGLHRIRRPRAGVGFSYARHRFETLPELYWDTNRDGVVDGNDPPLQVASSPPPASGLHLEAGRHVGGLFGVGFSAYVPTNNPRAVRDVRALAPSLPDVRQPAAAFCGVGRRGR